MSEHNKIDDLFKRNERGLNREPSDSAWNKLNRMLPREEEKAVVDPLEERVKSFEKPNPRIVKSPVPTWVRYAAVFVLFSIPLAAFLAIQNNNEVESKETNQQIDQIVAMNERDTEESFAIDGVGLKKAIDETGGDNVDPTEEKEREEAEPARKRFGDVKKMKQSIGNKGTTRPPVLSKPPAPKQDDRLNTGTPLPTTQTQTTDDDIDLNVNGGLAETETAERELAQTEQGYPIVHGMPADPGMEIDADDINPFRSNFDRQYKNDHPDADNLDKQYRSDAPSAEIELAEVTSAYVVQDSVEFKEGEAVLKDDSDQFAFEARNEAMMRKESSYDEEIAQNDVSMSQSTGVMTNSRVALVNSKLSKFFGTWLDEDGINKYDIIQTGPNTASVDVYREGKLSRNYQLLDTAEGITMMLYDNDANQGTTEYLVQSMNKNDIQFFLPSDPTNLVRFELKKKKLIVTEQQSATESRTFKLKKLE